MRIANIMLGRHRGGLEQAFVDYNEALLSHDNELLAITDPNASVPIIAHERLKHHTLSHAGNWDLMAAHRLKRLLRDFRTDITILHGNRAILLTQNTGKAAGLRLGVTHNYNLKHFSNLDIVFATTKDLQRAAYEAEVSATHLVHMPNMVRLPSEKPIAQKVGDETTPIIIGAMGRFVPKKGFHELLQALGKLKTMTRHPFKLHLAGQGEEEASLRQKVKDYHLEKEVIFTGWVDDKAGFFAECDIFCLPSLHEPFGIVLLEAMAHSLPIIAYNSEGPSEIFQRHPDSGIMVETGDTGALAAAIERLINNAGQREFLATHARQSIAKDYTLEVIGDRMNAALLKFLG